MAIVRLGCVAASTFTIDPLGSTTSQPTILFDLKSVHAKFIGRERIYIGSKTVLPAQERQAPLDEVSSHSNRSYLKLAQRYYQDQTHSEHA